MLANGTLVTTSASVHPDLFWTLRGGGVLDSGLILTVVGVCVVCVVGGFVGGYWGVGDGGGWWRWYSGLGLGFDHRFRILISQSVMSLLRTRRAAWRALRFLRSHVDHTCTPNSG